jgi:ferric-dicitrate binding protein FerR (iron transport regulator)
MLTLADGRHIRLDSAANGALAWQGNARVIKLASGQLAYNSTAEKPTEVLYNTLTTSKGGQTSIVLADGTKVWLNAASSLHFPTTFTGADRSVELTGEAYFEVAKDPARPLRVTVNGAEVEVLGTSFNIDAYGDEPVSKTTLLSGSIKVSVAGAHFPVSSLARGTVPSPSDEGQKLSPGQQAQIQAGKSIRVIDNADIDQAVAWKNGIFLFHSADLASILRQAARWYDVDIDYQRTVSTRFNGEVPRNTSLSHLLKIIELSGDVRFGIEGKKIIVLR